MDLNKYLVGVLLTAASSTAYAHTPYLAPATFEQSRQDRVTLDASFAESFFVPEAAFNNSIFTVLTPEGKTQTPDSIAKFKLRTVVEHQLTEDGTYRFSTGKRLGRVFKMYELDGKRKSLENPTDPVPEGGKLVAFFQSLTQAETYVTKGGPDQTALKPYGVGLEFVALSHPNELFANESLNMVGHFNGKPLADLQVDIYAANDQFGDSKPSLTINTNARGEFTFTPKQQGVYLLRARHRTEAPKGSAAPQISNTYTLVIEAVE